MDENYTQNKKINILIPKLLIQSNKFKKVFKNKAKIDKIFKEFENKSSLHFKFFIKESINRYKNMKIGNDLDKLIANSEKRRTTESNRILTDNFFTDIGIREEKKKSKYYTSDKIYKNLKKTFKALKELELIKAKKFNREKFDELMDDQNSNFDEKQKISELKDSKELINQGKRDINKIYKNEENKIIDSFDKYKKDVKTLKEIGEKSKEKYAIMHRKIDIALPKLEMINYTRYESPKKAEQDVEILQKKTLKKILPYTKYNNNIDKNNSKGKNLKLKKLIKNILLVNKSKPALKSNIINNDGKFKISEMNDTNEIVYNTAYNELTAKNSINEKRRKLNEILGYDSPKIENYGNIIKDKFKEIKNKRNERNLENMKYQKYASMTYYDKMNLKIDNEIYLLTQVEKNLFKNQKEMKK